MTSLLPTAAPWERRLDAASIAARSHSPKAAILEAAIRLFCRDGIAATGIDAVVREAGVARMTIYNHFGSKDGLVIAALEQESAAWRTWFFARLAALQLTPAEKLLAVFDILSEWFERDDYFGCALMNAVLEVRNNSEALMAVTMAHKKPVLEQLRAIAVAAGVTDPIRFTEQFDLIMNGAIVNALFSGNTAPAQEAKSVVAALLNSHI
jgi:AcrR family transcriptional regulator